MNIKRHIPNLITLLNLFSGCIALVFATHLNFEMAFWFVSLGIFLDFFDGFFARLFKVSSPLGLQLDSLADMVTSGLVPGYVMYQLLSSNTAYADTFVPYLGFIITLGSCYRLANFNIDIRQTDSFIGLPTPANALLILSLPLVLQYSDSLLILELLTNIWVLLAVTCFSAYLLNAEIPLFSLKVKEYSLAKNKLSFGFLVLSVVFLVLLKYSGVPLVILTYIVLSVIHNRVKKVTST